MEKSNMSSNMNKNYANKAAFEQREKNPSQDQGHGQGQGGSRNPGMGGDYNRPGQGQGKPAQDTTRKNPQGGERN